MVVCLAVADACIAGRIGALALAADERAQPLLLRLDPERRAKVLMALVGLVLVGGMLVAIAYLGGRHLRRMARKTSVPTSPRDESWYRKPLVPRDPPLPEDRE